MDERSSLGTVSKRGCFFRNARARNTHVEATLNHPFAAQARSVEGHTAALAKLNADLVQKCEALMRKSKRPRAPRDFDAY